ncbi:hypothetical protein VRRI112168_08190 [Vreelandella rituensis]|nr:hypothetical protein [Halomonas rituensis]
MKHQWITAAALASVALFITPAVVAAEDDTRLFKHWHYGQHIDDFPL